MKELPNCKIGVTCTVYHKLRELKLKGDTFNDVVERLLPSEDTPDTLDKFDAVAEAYKLLSEHGTELDPNCQCTERCTLPCEY